MTNDRQRNMMETNSDKMELKPMTQHPWLGSLLVSFIDIITSNRLKVRSNDDLIIRM